jgi:hypothetical protein
MAQKTTTKAPAAAASASTATPAAASAPAAPKTVDTFVAKNAIPEGGKLAPQARVIVNTVHAAKSITREALINALDGKLVTRQPIGRIVTYYQKALIDAGYIAIETAPVAA